MSPPQPNLFQVCVPIAYTDVPGTTWETPKTLEKGSSLFTPPSIKEKKKGRTGSYLPSRGPGPVVSGSSIFSFPAWGRAASSQWLLLPQMVFPVEISMEDTAEV